MGFGFSALDKEMCDQEFTTVENLFRMISYIIHRTGFLSMCLENVQFGCLLETLFCLLFCIAVINFCAEIFEAWFN